MGKARLLCSAHERRADEASYDVMAWLKCNYMQKKLGQVFKGVISGVSPFAIFVTLEDLYVEGAIHISGLGMITSSLTISPMKFTAKTPVALSLGRRAHC